MFLLQLLLSTSLGFSTIGTSPWYQGWPLTKQVPHAPTKADLVERVPVLPSPAPITSSLHSEFSSDFSPPMLWSLGQHWLSAQLLCNRVEIRDVYFLPVCNMSRTRPPGHKAQGAKWVVNTVAGLLNPVFVGIRLSSSVFGPKVAWMGGSYVLIN